MLLGLKGCVTIDFSPLQPDTPGTYWGREMVDTIRVYTRDFKLLAGNRFKTKTIATPDGEVESVKSFLNFPHLKIELPDEGLLTVETSVPKLLYGTNLFECKAGDYERAVGEIRKHLAQAGVSVSKDFSDFRLSRVDFCRNLQVNSHPMDYLIALSTFAYPRAVKREIAHETLTFRNTNRELELYNKVKEIRDKERDPNVLRLVKDRPEDILRVESRLKRPRAVKRVVRKETLSEVFDLELSRKILSQDLDRLTHTGKQTELFNLTENLTLLTEIAKRRKRGVFREFLAVRGTETFLKDFRGDWGKIREFLEHHYSRTQVYTILRDLREHHEIALEPRERDLLREIKDKLAA